MNAAGAYVAPGQRIEADDTITGEPPESDTESFWVSGLCSPFRSIGDRAAAYVEAVQSGTARTSRRSSTPASASATPTCR